MTKKCGLKCGTGWKSYNQSMEPGWLENSGDLTYSMGLVGKVLPFKCGWVTGWVVD